MDAGTTDDRQHEAIREQLGAYAFGDLSPDEHALVRDHLRDCSACREELADLRAALAALPLVLEEMAPPAGLRDRIEAAVIADLTQSGIERGTTGLAAEPPARPTSVAELGPEWGDPPRAPRWESDPAARTGWPAAPSPVPGPSTPTAAGRIDNPGAPAPAPIPLRPSRRSNAGWLAAAALLLLSIGLFGWNQRLREDAARPTATVVALAPQPVAPGASGEVRIDPAERLIVLDVNGLPPLAEGEVYQAWLLGPEADSPPTPAGTFSSPDGRHAITAELSEGWTGVAITAEPGPLGSPQPTSDIVAIAKLV